MKSVWNRLDSVADFGLLMALAWSSLITYTSARSASRIKVIFETSDLAISFECKVENIMCLARHHNLMQAHHHGELFAVHDSHSDRIWSSCSPMK